MSEYNRNNFIDANGFRVVIYMVMIAWGVTFIECFCACYFNIKDNNIAGQERNILKKELYYSTIHIFFIYYRSDFFNT